MTSGPDSTRQSAPHSSPSAPTTLRKEILAARDALRSAVDRGDQAAQLVRLRRLTRQGRGQLAEESAPAAGSVLPSKR
ncbi:hypothetical protein ACFQ9Z_38250 [Streptomyces sp. NPDC056580]|uniref:hypothetical protein n=1 Tax=Streptomyces sp. NPDC056580 TaxID=3345872 RepID=UPI00367A2C64